MRHYALEQRNLYFGILTAFADGASEIRLLITYPLFASSLQCFVTVLAESYAISVGSRTTICSALNHFSGIPKLLCQAHSLIRPGPKKPGQVIACSTIDLLTTIKQIADNGSHWLILSATQPLQVDD